MIAKRVIAVERMLTKRFWKESKALIAVERKQIEVEGESPLPAVVHLPAVVSILSILVLKN
jgi:hypothetical protein